MDGVSGMAGSEAGATGAGEAGAASGVGIIDLTERLDYSGGPGLTRLSVSFQEGATDDCTETVFGDCSLFHCTTAAEGTYADAGRITVRSDAAAFDATLVPDQNHRYLNYQLSGTVFHGGERVSVAADGGMVPALGDEIDFPELIVLTAPVASGGELSVPQDQDLTFVWDRGTPGVRFSVSGRSNNDYFGCTVAAEAGTLMVPATLLAGASRGDLLELDSWTSHAIRAGDFQVRIDVVGDVIAPDQLSPMVVHVQ